MEFPVVSTNPTEFIIARWINTCHLDSRADEKKRRLGERQTQVTDTDKAIFVVNLHDYILGPSQWAPGISDTVECLPSSKVSVRWTKNPRPPRFLRLR